MKSLQAQLESNLYGMVQEIVDVIEGNFSDRGGRLPTGGKRYDLTPSYCPRVKESREGHQLELGEQASCRRWVCQWMW